MATVITAPLSDVESIFELPDELFVAEAYFRVLGRPCDPGGFAAHLQALRRGTSRTVVLLALQSSSEALELSGRHTALPRLGVDLSLWPAGLPWSGHGLVQPARSQLLSLRGSAFVDALCTFVAQRPGKLEERAHWLRHANTEAERFALLQTIEAAEPWFRRIPILRPRIRLHPRPVVEADHPTAASIRGERQAKRIAVPLSLHGMRGTVAFTIATRSYLPYVRVLMRSVKSFHPEFHLICVLVDEQDSLTTDEPDTEWATVTAVELDLPGFDDMTWRYDATELCTALKPMFMRWLLHNTAVDHVYYLDPDIRLFAPMSVAQDILRHGAPMILTPHIMEPLKGSAKPDTHTILKSGTFNLGFAAIARHAESSAFVDWWAERLRTDAVVDFAANQFTDQRWCDVAPSFVAGLVILRHAGYNVAYWNLPQRRLHRDASDRWLANDEPLVLFHFSGVDPERPRMVSKYQDRLSWDDLKEGRWLFDDYLRELVDAGWQTARTCARTYDSVDGVEISPTMRRIYRSMHGEPAVATRSELLTEFLALCRPDRGTPSASSTKLTSLMRRLHASRTDLQSTFDLDDPLAVRDYSDWFWASGAIEHGLAPLLRRASQACRPALLGQAA